MEQQEEIWKEINGFDGKYSVSNLGRIRVNYHIIKNQFGYYEKRRVERYLKPQINNRGYYTITFVINNKRFHMWLHRVIATAFTPNPNNLPEINHKNGIPGDFRIENLEWIDRIGNVRHAWETGLCKNSAHLGEDHPRCKITEDIVLNIRKSVTNFRDNKIKYSLANEYGIHITTVNDILKRRSWSHI
jgi:hypothetical protein